MAKAIKNFISAFFMTFFTKWLEDFLILSAVILGVVNTYLISVISPNILAGNYVLAAFLFIFGLIFSRR